MSFKAPYPEHIKAEVIRRVAEGEAKSHLAEEFAISVDTVGAWTKHIKKQGDFDEAMRAEAIKRVEQGESRRKVAKDLCIPKSTLMSWTTDIGEPFTYSDEIKADVIRRAKAGEIKAEIARDLNISIATIHNWTKGINPRKPKQRVPEETRLEVIRRVESGELKKVVAKSFGLSPMTVSEITAHVMRKEIAEDVRRTFVDRVNKGEPLSVVSRSMNISPHTYNQWKARGLADPPHVTDEVKTQIISLITAGGKISTVSKDFSVPTPLIREWLRVHQGKSKIFPSFTKEQQIAAAKEVEAGIKVKDVAQALGASIASVNSWVRKAKDAGIVDIEKINKVGNKEFSWISRDYPHLEDWREPMVEWLKGEARGIGQRITALTAFLIRYVDEQKLPVTRSELLRKGLVLPDLYNVLQTKSNEGRKLNNTVHHFLNWILLHYFSDTDENGTTIISPLFRNPVSLVNSAGAPMRQESVRDVLPYGFIVQFRERLSSGPNFKDWTFAQSALGFETLKGVNANSDWFPVTEDRIDKADPDCVWRLRERLNKPSILEMWSPVRWVALLIKLQIPVRTGQVRVSDSGESDTWHYENGHFAKNTNAIAHQDERSPWAQGIFRKMHNHNGDDRAILYFNTNKTADALKSGSDKGQECPWPHFESQSENPYYWLEKLRNWQSKYNPIKRRTKWADLPTNRSLGIKSDIQNASYADTCFLFRTPESPGEEHLPITNAMLHRTWQKMMDTFEREFAEKKITHPDGSPIVLNDPRNGRTRFPPHGLRVSLITSMIIDGGVPPELMMKIVGHSRLVMTLYYTKPGYSHLRDAITDAADKLDAQKDESIIQFLKSASNDEVVKRVVFNTENWQSVIEINPAHRNPVGWFLMHDGICFAGGNTGPLDGNSLVPGCHNGGTVINKRDGVYAPVQGGAMNCSLCRWKAAEKHHGPALVATMNNQLYYMRQEQESAVKHSAAIADLKKIKARDEAANIPFGKARDMKNAERLYEAAMDRLAILSASVAGTYKMIQRLESLPETTGDGMALVSAGDCVTMNTIIEETNSELLQLAGICGDVEIYPDLNPGKAVFRLSQLLDAALVRESAPPFFMRLEEDQQLKYGNAFMRSLAAKANPENPMIGLREVISLIDGKESLQRVLGVNLPDYLPIESTKPTESTHLRITKGNSNEAN